MSFLSFSEDAENTNYPTLFFLYLLLTLSLRFSVSVASNVRRERMKETGGGEREKDAHINQQFLFFYEQENWPFS